MRERSNTLSNLTLLPPTTNSTLGDKGWPVKRAVYAACDYPMTARIAGDFDEQGGWTLKRVEDRAKALANVVTAIWPREIVDPHPVAQPANSPSEGWDVEEIAEGDDNTFGESLLQIEDLGDHSELADS